MIAATEECPSESTKDNVPTQSVTVIPIDVQAFSVDHSCRDSSQEEENPVENPFWHLKSNTNRPASGAGVGLSLDTSQLFGDGEEEQR